MSGFFLLCLDQAHFPLTRDLGTFRCFISIKNGSSFVKTSSLRYNLHILKFTPFRYTVQWVLTNAHSCMIPDITFSAQEQDFWKLYINKQSQLIEIFIFSPTTLLIISVIGGFAAGSSFSPQIQKKGRKETNVCWAPGTHQALAPRHLPGSHFLPEPSEGGAASRAQERKPQSESEPPTQGHRAMKRLRLPSIR